MNDSSRPSPSLSTLYWNDFTIRRSVHACVFGLLIAVGIQWASRPVGPVPPPEDSFELMVRDRVSLGGLVLAVVGAVFLARRYAFVTKTLRDGTVIKARVEDLDAVATGSISGTNIKPTLKHAHYATFCYTFLGEERKVRMKLPNSGFTFGLIEGGQTELAVLDSAPNNPLARAVYPGRPARGQ